MNNLPKLSLTQMRGLVLVRYGVNTDWEGRTFLSNQAKRLPIRTSTIKALVRMDLIEAPVKTQVFAKSYSFAPTTMGENVLSVIRGICNLYHSVYRTKHRTISKDDAEDYLIPTWSRMDDKAQEDLSQFVQAIYKQLRNLSGQKGAT